MTRFSPLSKKLDTTLRYSSTAKYRAKKHRSYEETWEQSDEHVWLIKIEFEYSECLKHTGESENYYAPQLQNTLDNTVVQ